MRHMRAGGGGGRTNNSMEETERERLKKEIFTQKSRTSDINVFVVTRTVWIL